jgi:hypothetical protein
MCPWTTSPSIESFVYPWIPFQCDVYFPLDLLSNVMFVCPWTPSQWRCLLCPWTSCLSMKQLPEHGLCSIPTLFSTNVAQELYIRIINIYLPERLYTSNKGLRTERDRFHNFRSFWPPLPWWGLRLKGNMQYFFLLSSLPLLPQLPRQRLVPTCHLSTLTLHRRCGFA